MPNTFEELLDEAADAGVDPDLIDRFRAASEASPLRKEVKELRTQVEQATARAQKAESAALSQHFKELGIKAKPSAFKLPDDLDVTDTEALQTWAVDQGLIDPPEPKVSAEHLDALDRVAEASAGSTGRVDPTDAVIAAENPEEFWQQAEQAGLTA